MKASLRASPNASPRIHLLPLVPPCADEGDAAAAWLSTYLGLPARLARYAGQVRVPQVQAAPAAGRRMPLPCPSPPPRAALPTESSCWPVSLPCGAGGRPWRARHRPCSPPSGPRLGRYARTLARRHHWHLLQHTLQHALAPACVRRPPLVHSHPHFLIRLAEEGAETAFADGFPFLLASEASLADLNSQARTLGGAAPGCQAGDAGWRRRCRRCRRCGPSAACARLPPCSGLCPAPPSPRVLAPSLPHCSWQPRAPCPRRCP